MFSILNRALSLAITSFGNKFCLKKRSRLIKASDNRFHVKFMGLEIGLFVCIMIGDNGLHCLFLFHYYGRILCLLTSKIHTTRIVPCHVGCHT